MCVCVCGGGGGCSTWTDQSISHKDICNTCPCDLPWVGRMGVTGVPGVGVTGVGVTGVTPVSES